VALLLLAILVSLYVVSARGLWTSFAEGQRQPGETVASEPPATVQTFITASAADDAVNLGRVTSPVYWLELRRRGVDPARESSDMILQGVTYVAIGGARDGYGYGHWLYATRVTSQRGDRLLTIWRVDTDPSDLVLWVEPGLLLANTCDQPIQDSAPRSVLVSRDPAETATLVVGARCPTSSPGYYLLRGAGAPTFTFVSIHEDGATWRSTWTFGHALTSREITAGRGYSGVDRAFKSPTEDVYLSYLRDLALTQPPQK